MTNPNKAKDGRFVSKKTALKIEYDKREISSAIANANSKLRNFSKAGDSYETRPIGLSPYLGEGYDDFPHGSFTNWPAQSDSMLSVGLDGDGRFPSFNNKSIANATKAAWAKIKMCRDVYENDGQVSSIIDLMADFATEGVKILHKSSAVQRFFEGWMQQVNLSDRIRRAIIDMLLSGVIFYYRVYAQLDASDITALKSYTSGIKIDDVLIVTKENGNDKSIAPKFILDSTLSGIFTDFTNEEKTIFKNKLFEKLKSGAGIIKDEKVETKSNRIPWKYISLNPLQMIPNKDGDWSYLLTKEDVNALLNRLEVNFDSSTNSVKIKMPDGFKGKLEKITEKTEKHGFYAEIKLNNDVLVPLQYNKFDWSKWSTPTVWKVLPTVIFKNTLRAMEMKTARAGINTVTLWKLGDHKEGLLPSADEFERLADMLKAPASTLNILWSSAIDAEVIQPDLKQIYDTNRWVELRKEVTSQFGITQSVVTGEGGNFSSSFISVQGLLERLSTLRELVMNGWLLKEIKIITDAMGFRNLPKVMFGQMSLRDEAAEKTFILNLADRGFISDETVMEYLKRDVGLERERLKKQKEYDKSNDITRRGPFIVQDGTMELEAQKAKTQVKLAEMRPKPTAPNGRPPGSKGIPQKKKRPVKPKNMAGKQILDFIQNIGGEGDDRINTIGYSLAESLYTDKLVVHNKQEDDHLLFFVPLAKKIAKAKESNVNLNDDALFSILAETFKELTNE